MTDRDFSKPWYHGSQQELSVIRAGSSVSQDRDAAGVFSHRPSLVSWGSRGLKHDGSATGYLHRVDEEITQDDVYPHPHQANRDGWEWVTKRDLRVVLLDVLMPQPEERLSADEIQTLRDKQRQRGMESFADEQ